MNDEIFGIDSGKWSTILVSSSLQTPIYFRTKHDENPDAVLGSSGSFKLTYNNKTYTIGEEAVWADYDTSKASLNHKLSIITAVGLAIGSKYRNVKLVVGCPVSIFKDKTEKEKFRNYLLEERSIMAKLNGQQIHFYIKDLILAPETAGYPYQATNNATNKLIGVIDIGGLNTNGCIYNGLSPIRESMFTVNEGMYILLTKLKNELNLALSLNIQDYELPHLETSYTSLQAQQIIQKHLKQHIQVITNEMKKNGWNVNGLQLVFIGGGSLTLKSAISQVFPQAIVSPSAIYDNANAFLKIGEIYYGQ